METKMTAKDIIARAKAAKDDYFCSGSASSASSTSTNKKALDQFVEVDAEDLMYLHVDYPHNRSSVWRMLCQEANRTFKYTESVYHDDGDSEERYYDFNTSGGVLMITNDSVKRKIIIEFGLPKSERVMDTFLQWEPCLHGVCAKLRELAQIASQERDLAKHYDGSGSFRATSACDE